MEKNHETGKTKDVRLGENEGKLFGDLNKSVDINQGAKKKADSCVREIINARPAQPNEVSFGGEREASRLMEEVRRHRENSRNYTRLANELERKIREKKVPQSKQYEVDTLRRKATREEEEARRCQQAAQRELLRSKGY